MSLTLHSVLNFIVVFVAVVGGSWELFVKPRLQILGYGREIYPINNKNCKKVTQLPACEKSVLHQPTGILYLACSTPSSRMEWTPALGRLNSTGASHNDYVATYNPGTGVVTKLKVEGFNHPQGLSLHGMDVVTSSSDPSELFIYLVNHRTPPENLLAKEVGADSVIEIFRTKIDVDGPSTLTHVTTVHDPVIITPNDITGSADGKSFYFTNDHGEKVGFMRELDMLGRATSSVGYCHIDTGCHFAITNIRGSNGIVRTLNGNGTFYVANCLQAGLYILDEDKVANTLSIVDYVPVDRGMDNLSLDSAGFVWAAAFPSILTLLFRHFSDPSFPAPSSALRFSTNPIYNATTHSKYDEAKYKVETLFEDDGNVASGITSVVYDAPRNLLFLSGLASPSLTVCKL